MIDRRHALSLSRQAALVGISRGSIYYEPRPVSAQDLALRQRVDRLHLEHPFAGTRLLRDLLNQEGHKVGRKHVRTLMQRMGLVALYRKPRTTQPGAGHQVYPYLLRGLSIARPNQGWGMDITYIPMARGFVYLTAVLDWYSRRVLAWRLSNTLDPQFCLEAVEEAIAHYGAPEILNTDQGCQFTSQAFTGLLRDQGIRISMDGKGAWRDNVLVERLWRSVKYEEIYLQAYASVAEVAAGLTRYFQFYNQRRPHSILDRRTPDQVYFNRLPHPVGHILLLQGDKRFEGIIVLIRHRAALADGHNV